MSVDIEKGRTENDKTQRLKSENENCQERVTNQKRERGGADDGGRHFTPGYDRRFSQKSVRLNFIKKVYGIVCACLFVSFSISLVCVVVEDFKEFILENDYVGYIFLGTGIVSYFALACCCSKQFPLNVILLIIMVISYGFVAGWLAAEFDIKAVILAMGCTIIITLLITILAWLCPIDLTSCGCCLGLVLLGALIFIVLATILNYFVFQLQVLETVISGVYLVVLLIFLLYNTQMILGGRHESLEPDDYMLGAVYLFIDIIYIFMTLLHLTGGE